MRGFGDDAYKPHKTNRNHTKNSYSPGPTAPLRAQILRENLFDELPLLRGAPQEAVRLVGGDAHVELERAVVGAERIGGVRGVVDELDRARDAVARKDGWLLER